MAKLSDEDLRVLLGDSFGAHQQREEVAALNSTASKIESWESWKFNSVAIFVLGVALIVGGFWLNGTHLGGEKMTGIAGAVIGAFLYLYSRARIRTLRSEQTS